MFSRLVLGSGARSRQCGYNIKHSREKLSYNRQITSNITQNAYYILFTLAGGIHINARVCARVSVLKTTRDMYAKLLLDDIV